MFRIVHESNAQPTSFICDPSAEFQPGQVAELVVIGNQIMATVSNGTCPIGIIDDVKTAAFSNISWNEEVIIPIMNPVMRNGVPVLPQEIMHPLSNPHIIKTSFSSSVKVALNPVNGIITVLEGTPLNLDAIGNGTPNAIRIICNYSYYIPNIPGDDSTAGSGRVTVWYNRMIAQTDMFETNMSYPLRALLYVSENGMFTTRRPSEEHPSVAIVTGPPSPVMPFLEFLWL